MRFEWDQAKNRRNLSKHKISFETAQAVFDDPNLLSLFDRIVDGDERWQSLGLIDGVIVVLVAHTYCEEVGEGKGDGMKKVAKSRTKEIRALQRMKDSEIDLSDLPEIKDWRKAVVGKFYRPIKESLTIRLDADVLSWLKAEGEGYQTRINSILREAMEHRGRP